MNGRTSEKAFNYESNPDAYTLGLELGALVIQNSRPELELEGVVTLDTLDQRSEFVKTSQLVLGHLIENGLVDKAALENHLRGAK